MKLCRNCNHQIPQSTLFCPQCGQKHTDGKISFGVLIQDFIANLFNLDSKLVLTTLALFSPGKLTIEYLKGRHKKYASPLRLFLITAIILVGISSLKRNDFGLTYKRIFEEIKETVAQKKLLVQLDSLRQIAKNNHQDSLVHLVLDSIRYQLNYKWELREDTLRTSLHMGKWSTPYIAKKDLVEMKPQAIVDAYCSDRSRLEKVFLRQAIKVLQGHDLFAFIFGNLSIIILLIMPFFASILMILYFRRKRYYVEHLIFSFHFHSFLFLLFSLFLILGIQMSIWLWWIGALTVLGYLFLSMKKVYQQGYKKTFLKFFVLIIAYFFMAFLFTIVSFYASLLLF